MDGRVPMPRSAKRAAPVPTVSEGVIDGCSDIYPLLADGLFSQIETTSTQDRRDNIQLIATYRLLCSDMRRFVDELIKAEFMRIVKTAMDLWKKAFALKKLGNSPLPSTATEQEKKEREDAVKAYSEGMDRLTDTYKTRAQRYFPTMYVDASIAAFKCNSKGAADLLSLHRTVSNFMAIARERCYAQCCTGIKNAANAPSVTIAENHTVVRFKDYNDVERLLTLYCRSDAFYRLCATTDRLRSSQPDAGTKLAVEMLRRRDMYSFDGMYHHADKLVVGKGAAIEGRSSGVDRVHNPTLVLDFHDLELPSIQKQLGVSATELASCKLELKHKESQKEERRQMMRDLDARILERDVDRAIARLKCGLNDLEEAASVFPGAVEHIRSALRLTDHKANSHAFDVRQVAVCFKDIKTVMGPIRSFDSKAYNKDVASAEAYDFITGKAACVMTSDVILSKCFASTSYGSKAFAIRGFVREGPSVFMAKTHEYDGAVYFPVDVVCSAMRAFDMMEDWKLHHDPDARPAVAFSIPFANSPRGVEACIRVDTEGSFQSMNADFVRVVNTIAEKRSLDIVIPMPPTANPNPNFMTWHKDTFSRLVAEPQTRSIALWMCGIYPRDLCQLVSKNGKLQDYLRSNGVHI